jgi:hypothetical protein
MNIEVFLLGLMIVSIFTSLVTEALKKIFVEYNVNYRANTLAGIVATVLSAIAGVGYIIFCELSFTPQIIICILGLIFMSWLCSMVGYDKVIGQFKGIKNYDIQSTFNEDGLDLLVEEGVIENEDENNET